MRKHLFVILNSKWLYWCNYMMSRQNDTNWSLVDEMRVARDNLVIHNLVTLPHIFHYKCFLLHICVMIVIIRPIRLIYNRFLNFIVSSRFYRSEKHCHASLQFGLDTFCAYNLYTLHLISLHLMKCTYVPYYNDSTKKVCTQLQTKSWYEFTKCVITGLILFFSLGFCTFFFSSLEDLLQSIELRWFQLEPAHTWKDWLLCKKYWAVLFLLASSA